MERPPTDPHAADKKAAAEAAVAEVEPGMVVGLGTGSTAAFAIAALARRWREGLRFTALPTSIATAAAVERAGFICSDPSRFAQTDLTIDGVDEIDPSLRAIKGAGGAMLREKVLAAAAKRMVAIAHGEKQVARLGSAPVPLEVLPIALAFVHRSSIALGAEPALRRASSGEPYRTDQGNLVVDCRFDGIDDPERMAARLSAIPGVLGHGLFVSEVDTAYIARDGIVTRLERGEASR